ncbi:MAG: ABC transporter ATP-binding protein [Flavobacteriales bacterium AspAUS03]
MNAFQRILAYSKPYKSLYFLNISFNTLYSLLSVVSVVSITPVLSILLEVPMKEIIQDGSSYPDMLNGTFESMRIGFYRYIIDLSKSIGKVNTLAIFCGFTILLFLIRNVFRYMADYYMVGIRISIARDIRNDFYRKILSLPVSFFSKNRKGDIMSRISNDVNEVENTIITPLAEIVSAPIMLLLHLTTLFLMSYQLTLFAFIVLPLMGIFISLIGKSLRKDALGTQMELGKLFSIIEETLNAMKIIKIFDAERQMQKRFKTVSGRQKKYASRVNRKRELASPISEFLGSITMILIVWYGGKLILEKKGIAPEIFLPFIGLFFQIINPAKSLANSMSNIQKGKVAAERIIEILDTPSALYERPNAQPIQTLKKEIVFQNIFFGYDDVPLIQNLNFTLRSGKTIALVGRSGSGKSTIASLLARFYDVTSGEITIDGVNIKDLKIKDYRRLFGMVTQDSILFNDSVFNNITLGIEDTSMEAVIQAAKVANAHDFIEVLPEGYHTFIGDGGNRLSGGQKQRLSIARAVLKNPPIMILDEATSSLDTESEKAVKKALNHMMKNRTSLIIAHRLSTVQSADHIIVLDNGRIIEQGRHEALIAQGGTYSYLISL